MQVTGTVKVLVDAQPRLARALVAAGHDAVHTLDLPEGNRSKDRAVAEAADADERVLAPRMATFGTATGFGGRLGAC